jgi:hypothetical protein
MINGKLLLFTAISLFGSDEIYFVSLHSKVMFKINYHDLKIENISLSKTER